MGYEQNIGNKGVAGGLGEGGGTRPGCGWGRSFFLLSTFNYTDGVKGRLAGIVGGKWLWGCGLVRAKSESQRHREKEGTQRISRGGGLSSCATW